MWLETIFFTVVLAFLKVKGKLLLRWHWVVVIACAPVMIMGVVALFLMLVWRG